MRLFLIRHGKPAAVWGEADDDPGLDDTGREQAAAVAAHLLGLPDGERPTWVVSSPLRRCRETAMTYWRRCRNWVSAPATFARSC